MKIGKIELLKAQGFKLAEKDGKKFIYAPLDETRLFYSDPNKEYGMNANKGTGRVYMDLVMFETPKGIDDYAVSESKTKEEMDDKELKLPIIGNFKNWKKQEEDLPTPEDYNKDDTIKGDLPF